MWDPSQHTDDENTLWCWLRAVEWGIWPLFISQLYAPPLLVLLRWQYVVVGFFVANVLWAFIRYSFISARLAGALAAQMILKWPVTIGCAVYLAWPQHDFSLAFLALLWPLVAVLLGVVTPVQIGRIQKVMMGQLGYLANEVPLKAADAEEYGEIESRETRVASQLWIAAKSGDVNRLRQLLASDSDTNVHEAEQGYTPMHLTCAEGHTSAARFLFQAGARLDLTDWEGHTPLHLAAAQGQDAIIDFLVEAGANVNTQSQDGSTPLHLAAGERHENAVNRLLEAGATVDVGDVESRTALHMAVFWTSDENPDIVKALLAHGANPVWKDRHGKTPVSRAEENGFEESSRLLHLAASATDG